MLGKDLQEMGGSEYLKQYAGKVTGKAPIIDIDAEMNLQKAVLKLIDEKTISAAHDTSEGGLAICLAEMAIASNGLGCSINLGDVNVGKAFGETQSRIVVSLSEANMAKLKTVCAEFNVPCEELGTVIKSDFEIKGYIKTTQAEMKTAYETAIADIMSHS